jgi:hypothetical protein
MGCSAKRRSDLEVAGTLVLKTTRKKRIFHHNSAKGGEVISIVDWSMLRNTPKLTNNV